MTAASHHYLEGNFAPVREELTVVDLPVTGTIPANPMKIVFTKMS